MVSPTPFSDTPATTSSALNGNSRGANPDPELLAQLESAVQRRFPETIEQLIELARIPGIAWEIFDPAELQRSAEAVAELARSIGLDDVQILREFTEDGKPGGPAVIARRPARPGKPTVLLYAHHDVQPPGDRALWESDPFQPEQRGERLWGRGVADDKAGVLAHIAALSAVTEVLGEELGLGVTLFIEGEEEAGSPTFRTFLEKHRELLRSDLIIVADSVNWKVGTPALTTSLRGLVSGVVELEVLDHAVHSGMYGGPVLDAPTQLARLIATLHDASGEVAVAGLHRGEEPTIDYPEADFRQDAGVLEGVELAGSGSLASRLWAQPALSVIGIDVTDVASSSNTILPSARAQLSLRLAPGDDPQTAMTALQQHIEKHAPATACVRFIPGEQGQPFRTDIDAPAAQAMLWALQEAWGNEPVAMGMGGSIPFIADLTELYPEAEILITGVEDPDSRAHSANESLHLAEFQKAILAEALLLARLNQP
ncbi:dipeptidase [Acaricomes phytoseiuli]|uniref:dipeptidase n=1 Tax=Acaricomes phytoseiuli TaxID=291968 RepID=UPI00037BDC33|nr:dipeptidase [Acaricomes phytoseiuli]